MFDNLCFKLLILPKLIHTIESIYNTVQYNTRLHKA